MLSSWRSTKTSRVPQTKRTWIRSPSSHSSFDASFDRKLSLDEARIIRHSPFGHFTPQTTDIGRNQRHFSQSKAIKGTKKKIELEKSEKNTKLTSLTRLIIHLKAKTREQNHTNLPLASCTPSYRLLLATAEQSLVSENLVLRATEWEGDSSSGLPVSGRGEARSLPALPRLSLPKDWSGKNRLITEYNWIKWFVSQQMPCKPNAN